MLMFRSHWNRIIKWMRDERNVTVPSFDKASYHKYIFLVKDISHYMRNSCGIRYLETSVESDMKSKLFVT